MFATFIVNILELNSLRPHMCKTGLYSQPTTAHLCRLVHKNRPVMHTCSSVLCPMSFNNAFENPVLFERSDIFTQNYRDVCSTRAVGLKISHVTWQLLCRNTSIWWTALVVHGSCNDQALWNIYCGLIVPHINFGIWFWRRS